MTMVLPDDTLSIYVRYVELHVCYKSVAALFKNLDIGIVNNIQFTHRDGKRYKSMCIYFKYWLPTQNAICFQQRILNPELVARIVYDDPHSWIVEKNIERTCIKNAELVYKNSELHKKLDSFYELFEMMSKKSLKLVQRTTELKLEKKKLEEYIKMQHMDTTLKSDTIHLSYGFCFN